MLAPDLERTTREWLRPRYASANIRTWIGFKQFMSLAEEAVLAWFRERGHGPQEMYHRYGLGLEVVDSSVQLPSVLEIDDEVEATVRWLGGRRFDVRLTVPHDGGPVTAMRGRLTVALIAERAGRSGVLAEPVPDFLAPLVAPDVAGVAPVTGPANLPSDLYPTADPSVDARGSVEPFTWSWRARYFHCHYSDRVQHGTYVQALEEVVDRFLADRGLSVPRLLAERGWIPVVSRARVQLVADAYLDEQVSTSFRVEDVVKDRAFDGRMDAHVTGPAGRRHVATARILHGYAVTEGPETGTLATLDSETIKALTGAAV